MADFFVIRLINKDGTRGWLVDRPEGISISTGGVISDITQFDTEELANKFIRERKLERSGVKAYVRTNGELIEDVRESGEAGMLPSDTPIYHIENEREEKLFYDSKREVYFFKQMGEFGFPIWNTEEEIRVFVKEMKFQQPMIFMVKHHKDKKEKTPIQVYGRRKNEDGTMGEPEYIDLKEGDSINKKDAHE